MSFKFARIKVLTRSKSPMMILPQKNSDLKQTFLTRFTSPVDPATYCKIEIQRGNEAAICAQARLIKSTAVKSPRLQNNAFFCCNVRFIVFPLREERRSGHP